MSLVVAALSGGVDSATAAALLVEQGHRVVGMTMRLYDARGTTASSGRCCGPRDIEEARAVSDHLGIPHFVLDGDYAGFVAAAALKRGRTLPMAGAIVDTDGTVLGRHDGTHNFTVGQHPGLGNLVVPPKTSGKARIFEKRYVTSIDPAKGEVRVGTRDAAERRALSLRALRWLSPPRATVDAVVQVRHRGQPLAVTATVSDT